jgi:hypothetical protein
VNRADLHIRFQVPFDDGGLKVLVDEMEASHTPIVVEGGEYSLLDGHGEPLPLHHELLVNMTGSLLFLASAADSERGEHGARAW